jgi:hypothetical protein
MSKTNRLYTFLIALSSIFCSSCDPDLYSDPYSTKLDITYTVTEDLLEGLTPMVDLNVNGKQSQFSLSRADFTSTNDNKLKYEKTISYIGEKGEVKMGISYVKRDNIPSKESYAIGHSLSAESVTTCGSSRSRGSTEGAASIGSNNSGMSYSEALDETVSRGTDLLAFAQAQLVSSMSVTVQGKK